jgi:ABC-2 type transport system ATP-binding protein
MSIENLISVKNFKMKFGSKTVIEDLSFEVKRGEVFGFLGSNGSGKTTTIRALLGIYPATQGELLIDGKVFDPSMGQFLGYLPEERGLYKKESVLDTMVYFGRLKGMSYNDAKEWSLGYLTRVELQDKAKERLAKLSGGQQQKIQLGVTIMNNPKLLILDEPTKGFDPVNRRLMMDIIEEQMDQGATVVLVTHQMEEAERLCHRVMLLKDGRRRLYGTLDEIKKQYGSNIIDVSFGGELKPDASLYSVEKTTAAGVKLIPKTGIDPQKILASLVQQGLRINKFEVQQISLDEIFVRVYREDKEVKNA